MCARAAGWIAQALNTWFWENTLFWFVLESSLIHLEELKPTETSFKLEKKKIRLIGLEIPMKEGNTTLTSHSPHCQPRDSTRKMSTCSNVPHASSPTYPDTNLWPSYFPKLINDLRAFAGGNSIPKTKPNKTKTKLALNDIFQGFCRNFQVGVEKFK
jgi:hypothetical protein